MEPHMPIQLRDYQLELRSQAGGSLRRVKKTLLQLPPGGGKTAIATSMVELFAARASHAWFICHRDELVQQTSLTFARFGVAHSFIAAGREYDPGQLVQVCSIDTLKLRLATLRAPRLAIVDEAHHSGAAGWALVIEWLVANGASVIGLSGTPVRHDGGSLAAQYDELVLGPTVPWLMEHGHLSQYDMYAPDKPSRKGLRSLTAAPAARRMSEPKLTGNMIAHWKEHARGLLTVGFGVNIAHSKHLAELFQGAGINAVHLDGGTKREERRAQIADFGPGGIEVIFNVGLFGEGFDLSAIAQRDITIDAVIDAAPSDSLSWFLQKVMRCMRPAPGKRAVILDHANNSDTHGFPDDLRDWAGMWMGRQGAKAAANDNGPPPPITCEGCFRQIRRPAPDCCPTCGKTIRADYVPPEVAEGILRKQEEADRKQKRAAIRMEQAACKDLSSLVAHFQKQGSKNPMHQARQVLAGRHGLKMRA
jgi:superfamily II DNA or RNA helicase